MRTPLLAVLFASTCSIAWGCADILGIEDGIPRLDSGNTQDVATKDVFSPLHCGSSTCNFAGLESCCVGDDGGKPQCASSTTVCSGLYIPCDRTSQCEQPADAGPIVCCADYEPNEAGTIIANGVSCVPAADCNQANDEFILCGGDSGASDCPADASCGVSTVSLPTFPICLGGAVK